MKQVEVGKKRNIAVVGHHGSGKTSLLEAILYYAGIVDRLGRIDDRNTYADYLDEEKEKKHTLVSKILHCSYNGYEMNFIDTPGYSDFIGDIKGALHAADGALVVINAQNGVEVETEKIWDYLEEFKIPRVVVVNKMDKERADFDACLSSLESVLGAKVCPVRLPLGKEDSFKGVIDLVMDKVISFDAKGGVDKQTPIPEDLQDEVAEYRQKMIESSVETNEELMERYFNDEKISDDEIRQGLKDGALSGAVVPVFATDAFNGVGIQSLLDGLINYIPNPLDRKTYQTLRRGKEDVVEMEMKEDGDSVGFVYKSFIDPFAGKVSFVRLFSGVFNGEMEWVNRSKEKRVRVGHILAVNGKKFTAINRAETGDIVALAKLDEFETNDTVSMSQGDILVVPTKYPQPPIKMALHAADKNDEDKVGNVLHKIVSGDPTVSFERDNETKETVITAQGSMQVELIAQRLHNQYKLNVELTTPKVAYRETITAQNEGSYRHKKQTGGRGQFGEVHLRLRPLERGKQYEFVNSIFGGAIPTKFVPAVEKGIVDAMSRGIIAGYPVVDVCVEVYDGKFHDVDSSEMAFKIASSMCFRQVANPGCKPILLEPIMNVLVTIPESYMGDVMGDLNSRRGRVMGMDAVKGRQIIRAQVPLAEMYTYSIDLRSITQGRGGFEMEFSHYDPVPKEIELKIVAESKMEEIEEE